MSASSSLRGLRLPLRPGPDRRLATSEGGERVQQSILVLLLTEPGERPLRPGYGCGLRRYLMQPNNIATRTLMQHDIEQALRTWEPRIQVSEVRVLPAEDPHAVIIDLSYVHTDGQPGNMQFPFYLE